MLRLDARRWTAALGLGRAEIPVAVVLEGSWWARQRTERRLSLLDDVRELGLPDLWWGRHRGVPLVYAPAYGAPRAVEPVHVLGSVGTTLALQIGTCGALQPQVRPGDVVVCDRAVIAEGASAAYGASGSVAPEERTSAAAAAALRSLGRSVHRGPVVTTSALLVQPPALVRRWHAEGLLGVDMETSAVLSAARALDMAAASLLVAWDLLLEGRSFLDPLPTADAARFAAADAAVFAVALDLAAAER